MQKPIHDTSRAEAQRERLLDAASEVFLRHGFGIATVDDIATNAKASKKTLYSYFDSKEDIFVATVERLCQRTLAPLHELEIDNDDPETLLIAFGTRLLEQVLSPVAVAIYRMAISEATRFPELSRLFYQTGPANVRSILSRRLKALQARGRLKLGDTDLAAGLFIQMVLGEPQLQVALAVSPPPSFEEARMRSSNAAMILLRALGAIPEVATDTASHF